MLHTEITYAGILTVSVCLVGLCCDLNAVSSGRMNLKGVTRRAERCECGKNAVLRSGDLRVYERLSLELTRGTLDRGLQLDHGLRRVIQQDRDAGVHCSSPCWVR